MEMHTTSPFISAKLLSIMPLTSQTKEMTTGGAATAMVNPP